MTEEEDDRSICRREFLHSVGCVGMTLTVLGLGSSNASALPVSFIEAVQNGSERHYPIPPADSVNVDRAANVIVVRYQNRVYVFSLSCPHQNNAVKWVQKDLQFQCTKHDSHYQPDGLHVSGRATRNMDRYVIRREGDSVVVDLRRWIQSDKDPGGWAAATIEV
jgi:nitrite reductase/ring-hydroxylating ferredoxin subunit